MSVSLPPLLIILSLLLLINMASAILNCNLLFSLYKIDVSSNKRKWLDILECEVTNLNLGFKPFVINMGFIEVEVNQIYPLLQFSQ